LQFLRRRLQHLLRDMASDIIIAATTRDADITGR
jgi:hypothetical protein